MEIVREGFTKPIPDNDALFISFLEGVIESVDENCAFSVRNNPLSYVFKVSPSKPSNIERIINAVIEVGKKFKIFIDFSKSMKATGVVFFKVSKKFPS